MSEHQTPDERFVAERLKAAAARPVAPTPDAVLRHGRARRRRQRWGQGAVALTLLGGASLGATQLDLARAERRDVVVAGPSPSAAATARTGPIGMDSGGSCAFEYNERTLAERTLAFDGTVRAISSTSKKAARYYTVDFDVNRWYAGGSGSTLTVGFPPPGDGTGSAGPDDFADGEQFVPVYQVGTRFLVGGMADDGLHNLPIVWTCGFTRYWSQADGAVWDRVFGRSLGSPTAASSNGPVQVRGDANVDDARYPYSRAEDWTTYADHVVVATVTAEKPGDASGGSSLRDITVRVDEVLWSADKPGRAAPATFTIENTWGWNGETRVAVEKRSRLEVGHTYLLPLRWQRALCDPGDGRIPGSWGHLAGKAPLPYEEGTIGTGEVAGSDVRADNPQFDEYTLKFEQDSLRVRMNGRSAADLQELLEQTRPGKPKDYGSGAPVCDDQED